MNKPNISFEVQEYDGKWSCLGSYKTLSEARRHLTSWGQTVSKDTPLRIVRVIETVVEDNGRTKHKYINIDGSMRRVYSKVQMQRMANKNQDIIFRGIDGTTDGWLVSHSAVPLIMKIQAIIKARKAIIDLDKLGFDEVRLGHIG